MKGEQHGLVTEEGIGCHRSEAEVSEKPEKALEKAAHRICGLQRTQPQPIDRAAGRELENSLEAAPSHRPLDLLPASSMG